MGFIYIYIFYVLRLVSASLYFVFISLSDNSFCLIKLMLPVQKRRKINLIFKVKVLFFLNTGFALLGAEHFVFISEQ